MARPDAPDGPEHGGRVLFVLAAHDETKAEYRVTLLANEHEYVATMNFTTDGDTTVGAWSEPPPEWLEKSVRGFTRQLKLKQRELGKWPRRLLRWRKPKA